MVPRERQKIEIEKTHEAPLHSLSQAVTENCSDFLGTALMANLIALFALKRLLSLVTSVVSCEGIGDPSCDCSNATIQLLKAPRIHCRIEKHE